LDAVTVFFTRLDPPGLDCVEAFDRLALIAHGRISGEARVDCRPLVAVLRRKKNVDRFRKPKARRLAPLLIVQAYPKRVAQACLSSRGDPHRTRVALPHQPAQLQTASPNLGANEAGNVISTLAPVEAWPAKDSPVSKFRNQVCTESRQEGYADIRDFSAFLTQHDVLFGNQRVGDGYAQSAGETVVAGPRETQSIF